MEPWWGGGNPLKAPRGEVVSPATGGRLAEPRRINEPTPAGGGGERGSHAPGTPQPRPLPGGGPHLRWDFGDSWRGDGDGGGGFGELAGRRLRGR